MKVVYRFVVSTCESAAEFSVESAFGSTVKSSVDSTGSNTHTTEPKRGMCCSSIAVVGGVQAKGGQ